MSKLWDILSAAEEEEKETAKVLSQTIQTTSEELIQYQEEMLELLRRDLNTDTSQLNRDGMRLYLMELGRNSDRIPDETTLKEVVDSILDDMYGYGPAQEYMEDPDVTDVRIMGPHVIEYKKNGKYYRADKAGFRDEDHLFNWLTNKLSLTGRRFDRSEITVNALLPDGSRLHAVTDISGYSYWSEDGFHKIEPSTIVTIRKFVKFFTPEELVKRNFMASIMMDYLALTTKIRWTTLFAGGMGTGKTTTMNTIFSFIQDNHKNGVLEEAPELQPKHNNVIRLWERQKNVQGKGEYTIRQMLKEALRMDLNRIFIAELRDQIAYYFLQAIINGHPGSMSTIHANSARATILRLIALAMSAPEANRFDVLGMIQEGVQQIVQLEKTDEDEKLTAEICEIEGISGDGINLRDVFTVEFNEDGTWYWKFHGLSDKLLKQARRQRMEVPQSLLEADKYVKESGSPFLCGEYAPRHPSTNQEVKKQGPKGKINKEVMLDV
ncbi:MAG: CpaF family protein [Bacillaceae bacterium]|nr:CpaF family protein [Bacillaceae bacterium]